MVGLAEAIEGDQLVEAHALTVGDFREGVAFSHGHPASGNGAASGGAAARATLAGHLEGLAHLDVVGLAEAIESDQLVEAHALAVGDFGEGVSLPHGHSAGGHGATAGGAAAGAPLARHLQLLPHLHVVGLADAVELHQPLHADAGAVGDFREGLARFHRDITGQSRYGQHQGEGEGGEGTAHGHLKRQWRHVKGRARARPAPPWDESLNFPEWGLDAAARGNG